MKKISLVLMVLLVSSAIVFAQNTGIESVDSSVSGGLYSNALDDAANVGSGFSALDNNYLFAGVTNIELAEADEFILVDDNPNGPLWTGFFKSGDMPWSLFIGFDAENTAAQPDDTVVNTVGGTETVVNGTTSTDYDWNSQVAGTEYTANRLLDNFVTEVQFLTTFGAINTGLYFGVDLTDNSTQANNSVVTQDFYTNTAVAGAVPVEDSDYTITTTNTDLDTTNVFTFGIPLFMATGDMKHTANVTIDITKNLRELDNAPAMVYSGNPDSVLGVVNNTEIDKDTTETTIFDVDADYELGLPGVLGSHPDNMLKIGAGVGVASESFTYNSTTITQNVNYAGSGAAGVDEARAESTTDVEGSTMNFNLGVNVAHSFYYDLGPAMFAFEPSLSFTMDVDNSGDGYDMTMVVKTDGNNDGAFNNALDTITTMTSSVSDDDGSGTSTTTNTYNTSFTLPVAVKVSPEKWPFSLTLGSQPFMRLRNTVTETKDWTSSTSQTVIDQGDGTNVSDNTVIQNNSSDTTTDIEHDVAIWADHDIGLSVPVGEYVELDVNLGFSSGASILDFRDFVIQAIVSLP